MKQILIVLDDLSSALLLRDALTEAGYAVCCATSMREAMQLVLTHPFAAVLADGDMLDNGRVGLIDLLSAVPAQVPTIVLATSDRLTELRPAFRDVHQCEKPVQIDQISTILRDIADPEPAATAADLSDGGYIHRTAA